MAQRPPVRHEFHAHVFRHCTGADDDAMARLSELVQLFPLLQPRLDVARHVADIEFDLELRDLHGAGEPHVVALPKF